jgi:hypothetical protein
MICPDGYSDLPAGKIAAVVTHLEMTERRALGRDPEGTRSLRRAQQAVAPADGQSVVRSSFLSRGVSLIAPYELTLGRHPEETVRLSK